MSEEFEDRDRQDVYELLPWFAAGTLSQADMARVSRAVAADPALAETLRRIEDERADTILESEAQPLPSSTAFDRLLARIETEAPRSDRSAARGKSPWSDLVARIAALAPRTIALAGVAAALVIVAEGGFLASLTLRSGSQQGVHYETASVTTPAGPMAFLLVQFANGASIDAITTYLRSKSASIVDGPKAGGLFRISIAADQASAVLADMKGRSDLIRFASPTK